MDEQIIAGFYPEKPKFAVAKTISFCLMYLTMGANNVLLGTTFVSITSLLDISTVTMAIAVASTNAGYLAGSLVCVLLVERLPWGEELQYALACAMLSIFVGAAPWMPDIIAFLASMSLAGYAQGYLQTGAHPYLLCLWHGHPRRNTIVHSVFFTSSLSASIMPYIIGIFLVDPSVQPTYGELLSNVTATDNVTVMEHNVGSEDDKEYVRWAYIVVCGMAAIATFYAFIVYFINKEHFLSMGIKKRIIYSRIKGCLLKDSYRTSTKYYVNTLLCIAFVFFFLFYSCVSVTRSFIAAFVILEFDWSYSSSAILTAVFTGAYALGELISIIASTRWSSKVILTLDVLVTASGYLILLLVIFFGDVVIWIGVTVAGLGLGSTFSTGIMWLSDYIPMTTLAFFVAQAGATTAGIVLVFLVGFLFDSVSPLSIVYVLMICAGINVLVYVCMHVWATVGNTVYSGKVKDNLTIHKTVIYVDSEL